MLRRVVARASFSGLGHEKLRELGLQGRIRFLPVFSFGLRFGKRATARTCTTSLTKTRFWGRGLQRNLAEEKARLLSRRRGNTKRGLRLTLQPFSFCLGRNPECRSICAGISLEGVGPTTRGPQQGGTALGRVVRVRIGSLPLPCFHFCSQKGLPGPWSRGGTAAPSRLCAQRVHGWPLHTALSQP